MTDQKTTTTTNTVRSFKAGVHRDPTVVGLNADDTKEYLLVVHDQHPENHEALLVVNIDGTIERGKNYDARRVLELLTAPSAESLYPKEVWDAVVEAYVRTVTPTITKSMTEAGLIAAPDAKETGTTAIALGYMRVRAIPVAVGDALRRTKEAVDPAHYDGDECMKAIERCGWGHGMAIGTALKYAWRLGRKVPEGSPLSEEELILQDARKIRWYVERYWSRGGLPLRDDQTAEVNAVFDRAETRIAESTHAVVIEAREIIEASLRKLCEI